MHQRCGVMNMNEATSKSLGYDQSTPRQLSGSKTHQKDNPNLHPIRKILLKKDLSCLSGSNAVKTSSMLLAERHRNRKTQSILDQKCKYRPRRDTDLLIRYAVFRYGVPCSSRVL